MDRFTSRFPDVVLSVIDTRNPNAGFVSYYMDDNGDVVTHTGDDESLTIPSDRTIVRLAATGNHFLSVESHPALTNGSITNAFTIQGEGEAKELESSQNKPKVDKKIDMTKFEDFKKRSSAEFSSSSTSNSALLSRTPRQSRSQSL